MGRLAQGGAANVATTRSLLALTANAALLPLLLELGVAAWRE